MPIITPHSPVARGVVLPSRYDPPPWYSGNNTISISDCLLAYQAKGAASLAASKINLANPGTYNATAGVDPTFSAATGWQFTGTQWLDTNLSFSSSTYANMTFAVQIAGGSGTFKTFAGKGGYTALNHHWNTTAFFQTQNGRQAAPATKDSGNIIVIGGGTEKVYYDGVDQSATWSAGGAAAASNHVVGRNDPAGGQFMNGYIIAYAVYKIALNSTQAAAVAAAMAAL